MKRLFILKVVIHPGSGKNMKVLLAKKLGMTTIYEENKAHNVTLVEVGENVVTDLRTEEKNGYWAVQVGLRKNQAGDKKEGAKSKKEFVCKKEFRLQGAGDFKKGQILDLKQFSGGDKVGICSVSKGKGFQGVVKKYGFGGSPASHGHRHDLRAPGSIGCAFPERVLKGKKMAGRMGGDSIKGVTKIISVDEKLNVIALKGSIAGNNGTVVEIYSL